MTMNVGRKIAELKRMTVTQLRQKHIEAFGEPTRSGHKDYLVKRIAWRLQAQEAGDLSQRARRRAEELANDADLRSGPDRLAVLGRAAVPRALCRRDDHGTGGAGGQGPSAHGCASRAAVSAGPFP